MSSRCYISYNLKNNEQIFRLEHFRKNFGFQKMCFFFEDKSPYLRKPISAMAEARLFLLHASKILQRARHFFFFVTRYNFSTRDFFLWSNKKTTRHIFKATENNTISLDLDFFIERPLLSLHMYSFFYFLSNYFNCATRTRFNTTTIRSTICPTRR